MRTFELHWSQHDPPEHCLWGGTQWEPSRRVSCVCVSVVVVVVIVVIVVVVAFCFKEAV